MHRVNAKRKSNFRLPTFPKFHPTKNHQHRKYMDKVQVNELSKEIQITTRSIRAWIQRGAPIEGTREELARWIAEQTKISAKARNWSRKVLAASKPKKTKRKKLSDETDELEILKAVLREHTAALDVATDEDNLDRIRFYTDSVKNLASTIRETEAHAKRMGLQTGETLPREEVERILAMVFNAGNACIERNLVQYCQRWADIHDPAELYEVMKPQLVFSTLFSGFSHYENAKGNPHLPQWVVDHALRERDNYITLVEDDE